MKLEEYEVMYRVEKTHWWYLGMKTITCDILDHFIGRDLELEILDAGCGTGAAMLYLAAYGKVKGMDFEPVALEFCRQRGLKDILQGSVLDMPYEDASFDLVTSFDVLCQLDAREDEAGLGEFMRVLKPGGHLVLRLPAYGWLRGKHDEQVQIRHRYTRRELRQKLQKAGFQVAILSYANAILFPVAVLKRMSERIIPLKQTGSDLTISTGMFNRLLRGVLAFESPLIKTIGLPFGLTVVAMARKPVQRA